MKKLILLSLFFLIAGVCNFMTAQEVKINSNFVIEADGTFRLDGDAAVWDDMLVAPSATKTGGSKEPSWTKFASNSGSQGVFLYDFSASSEQELYFTVQIPHSYKIGTAIYPHVHWTTTGTPVKTTADVVWGFEYTVIAIGGNFSATTTSILTTGIVQPSGAPSGTLQHLISEFPVINGTGLDISTIFMCRLYRAATLDNDNYLGTAGLLGFDFHYQKDTEGSRTAFDK